FDESLALIIGDLSPSSASAHMNYLIKLLKSNFLNVAAAGSMTDPCCLSEEGVFYAFRGVCQPLFSAGEASDLINLLQSSNFLTNKRFFNLITAGNAGRPRQRMRTLRIQCRVGKG
ncbi:MULTISPECIES: hypothetical protein, partial [unclassified Halomonas]|uniref:hypothetical protein n=1 Tax=unclassified Halomonas TaxID=2609666 RepID=UPI001EF612AE